MPFPLTWHRRLRLPAAPVPPGLQRLALALRREGAQDLDLVEGRVFFRVPWTVTFGPLWAVTRGELALEHAEAGHQLRYFLSLRRGCLSIAVAVLLWVAFEALWMGPPPGLAAFRGLVVWLSLWSAGYLWAAWRFTRFLRQVWNDTRPSAEA